LSGLPHAEHMFLANATPVIGGKRKTSLNSCGRWNASAMYASQSLEVSCLRIVFARARQLVG
jgi:hypothetical protein